MKVFWLVFSLFIASIFNISFAGDGSSGCGLGWAVLQIWCWWPVAMRVLMRGLCIVR